MRPTVTRSLVMAGALLVTTNGPVFFVSNEILENGRSWEEPFTRAVFVALAVAAVAAVALDRFRLEGIRLAPQTGVAVTAIGFFTGWAVLSSLWSLSPDITRGRSLIYVGLAALAWLIADLSFRDFRVALTTASFGAVLLSLVTVLLSDAIGTDKNGDWQGIFTNRNSLAPIAGVAVLVGLTHVVDARGRRRYLVALIPALSALMMLNSGSRTALFAVVVAAGAAALVVAAKIGGDRYGPSARRLSAATAVVGMGATILVVSRLWTEPTFVQRRTIWSHVWDRIAERPLQGFGWFNVWLDRDFTSAHPLLERGSAHDSFLEVWLGLGLIGLLPFLVVVGLAVYGATTAAWRRPSVASWLWLALVIFLVIENITESYVLWYSYNWVLLMVAALKSGVGSTWPRERRTRQATARASA